MSTLIRDGAIVKLIIDGPSLIVVMLHAMRFVRSRRQARNDVGSATRRDVFVAFVVIVLHLLSQIHAKSEAHTICADHPGEICHVDVQIAQHAHGSQDHEHEQGGAAVEGGSGSTPEDQHEHCPLEPLSSPHGGVVLSDPFVIVLPMFECCSAFVEIGSTLVPLRAPLTYAPKTSPPIQLG
jgi:hypothetical protein